MLGMARSQLLSASSSKQTTYCYRFMTLCILFHFHKNSFGRDGNSLYTNKKTEVQGNSVIFQVSEMRFESL